MRPSSNRVAARYPHAPKRTLVASASRFLSEYKKWTLPHGDPRYRSWWIDPKENLIKMKNDPSKITEDTVFGANTVIWKGMHDEGQGDIHFEYLNTNRDLRGRGVGSKVLTEIIKIADQTGVSISLEPDSRGGGLSTSQLFTWYRRHGFEEVLHPEWGKLEEMLIRFPTGSRVAARYLKKIAEHRPGDVWKAKKKWRAISVGGGGAVSFDTKDEADVYAESELARCPIKKIVNQSDPDKAKRMFDENCRK